jgi:acyl-CoA thioester hydrolase
MSTYNCYHPIEVRYGDIDPQGHVNNAAYLTYFEQARITYIQHLGLWDGKSFLEVGMILANAQVTFLSAVRLDQQVRVGVRVTRLGEKSFVMEYSLEETPTQKELARGSTVLVAYDYQTCQAVPIPEVWRHAISTFEEIPPRADRAEG